MFEKGLNVGETFDFASAINFSPVDATNQELHFKIIERHKKNSTQADTISISKDGVISVEAGADLELAVIRAISDEGNFYLDLLVVNKSDYNAFKFVKSTNDPFNANGDGEFTLIKPNGEIKTESIFYNEPCGAGVCYIILSATGIDLSNNLIIGEIKSTSGFPSMIGIDLSNNQITRALFPNAVSINLKNNKLTAKSIEMLFAELKTVANENGYLNISGTGNAPISKWTEQAILDKDYLINTLNWNLVYND